MSLLFLTLIRVGGWRVILPPLPHSCWFSLNNLETVKAVTLAFAVFSSILLETFIPNLVSLTSSSLQILGKTQTGYFRFRISGQSFIKENCHNSRVSADIDMKLGPVTKRDKRNKATSKKVTMR